MVATFHGLPPGSFQAQGKVTCASEVLPVSGPLRGDQFTSNVDLDQIGGHCSLTLTLHSTLSPDPYGVPSPAFTSSFSIGAVSSYRFSVAVSEPCGRYCATFDLLVTYNGSGEPPGTDWQVTAAGGPICDAGTAIDAAAVFPVTVKWPTTCPTPTVTVSWVYLGQAGTAVVGVANLPSLPAPPPPTTAPLPSTTVAPAADYHHLGGAPVHDGCHGRPGNDPEPAVQYNDSHHSNHTNDSNHCHHRNNSSSTNNNRPRHHYHPGRDNHHQLHSERLPDQHAAVRHNPAADHYNLPSATTLPATTLPSTTTTLPSATTLPATTLPSTTTTLPSATTLPPTTAAVIPLAGPRGPSGLGPRGAPVTAPDASRSSKCRRCGLQRCGY